VPVATSAPSPIISTSPSSIVAPGSAASLSTEDDVVFGDLVLLAAGCG